MKNYTLLNGISAASSATTISADLGDLTGASVQVSFSGSNVVGSVALLGSNDNVNFATIPSSTTAVSASSGVLYNLNGAQYRYVQVAWTYTSGTGNITTTVLVKQPTAL